MTAATLDKSAKKGLAGVVPKKAQISVGLGTCGIGNGAMELFEALKTAAAETGVNIKRTGCFGFCAEEPLLMIYTPGNPVLLFTQAAAKSAKKYITAATDPGALLKLSRKARAKISRWDFRTGSAVFGDPNPEEAMRRLKNA